MTQIFPVAIIGCGPAGAAASMFLSKAGIRHIILEKDVYPRDKVCGDGCSGKTAFVLRKANPEFLEEIFSSADKFLPSYGVKFVAPNGKGIDIPFGGGRTALERPPGFTAKRMVLDHFLFQKLPSSCNTIIQNAHVQAITRCDSGFEVAFKEGEEDRKIVCNILIGADGDKGISRKTLMQQNEVSKTSMVGLRCYYEGVSDMHPDNFIELHFLKDTLPGYFWIFPLPGGSANVGVGIDSAVVRSKKINLREKMQEAIAGNPNIKHRFSNAKAIDKIYGWGLPTGTKKSKVSGANFLLTGDAASLIDPFTGEGIGNALYSGMLAAEAAIKSVEEKKTDAAFFSANYDDVLFKRIGKELQLSHTMQRLVHFPWLFNLVVNKASKSPSLQQTMSSMFADLDVRSLLRKPSFYWNILMNK